MPLRRINRLRQVSGEQLRLVDWSSKNRVESGKAKGSEIGLGSHLVQPKPSSAQGGTLTNQTVQRFIGWLKEGKFKPGSKLPSQSELVESLGISRTGIREALQVMAALNLIEIRPGRGCFVKKVSAEDFINDDVLAILFEKEAIFDVIETRKILETGIAMLAAERATEHDFWRMEDVLNNIGKAITRRESVADIAPEFHNTLAEATHNAVTVKLMRSFNKLMAKAGKLVETEAADVDQFKRQELLSHTNLYKVIRTRNPAKAREAILKHITASEGLIIRAFKRAEAETR